MTDPKLEASKMFKQEEPASKMSDYEREQESARKNRERLKNDSLEKPRFNPSQYRFDLMQPASRP
jgi:hypothetical protein